MKYFLLTTFFLGNVSLLSQAHAMEDDQVNNNARHLPSRHTDEAKAEEDPMINVIKALVDRQSKTGEPVLASFSPSTRVLAVKLEEGQIGFNFLPVIPEDEEEVASTDKK